jgi:copper chaperone CopZ
MTKSTPVPIDGRDVILRDKYRAIVAEYSSEIVEILQAVKYDTEADTARLVKCVRDLDNARQQLLNIEVKSSYEESKSKETCGETDIDFDAMRQSIGRRLDRLRRRSGDVVKLAEPGGLASYRIDQVEQGDQGLAQAGAGR